MHAHLKLNRSSAVERHSASRSSIEGDKSIRDILVYLVFLRSIQHILVLCPPVWVCFLTAVCCLTHGKIGKWKPKSQYNAIVCYGCCFKEDYLNDAQQINNIQ